MRDPRTTLDPNAVEAALDELRHGQIEVVEPRYSLCIPDEFTVGLSLGRSPEPSNCRNPFSVTRQSRFPNPRMRRSSIGPRHALFGFSCVPLTADTVV